jgi:hypothetical protein
MTLIGGHIDYIAAEWDKRVGQLTTTTEILNWSNNIEYYNGVVNNLVVVSWSNNMRESLSVKARTSIQTAGETLLPQNTEIIVNYLNGKPDGTEIIFDYKLKMIVCDLTANKAITNLFYSYPPIENVILLRDKNTGKVVTAFNSLGRVSAVFVDRYAKTLLLTTKQNTKTGEDFLTGLVCKMFGLMDVDSSYSKIEPKGGRAESHYHTSQTKRLYELAMSSTTEDFSENIYSLKYIAEHGIPKVDKDVQVENDIQEFKSEFDHVILNTNGWLHFYPKDNVTRTVTQQDIIKTMGFDFVVLMVNDTFDNDEWMCGG